MLSQSTLLGMICYILLTLTSLGFIIEQRWGLFVGGDSFERQLWITLPVQQNSYLAGLRRTHRSLSPRTSVNCRLTLQRMDFHSLTCADSCSTNGGHAHSKVFPNTQHSARLTTISQLFFSVLLCFPEYQMFGCDLQTSTWFWTNETQMNNKWRENEQLCSRFGRINNSLVWKPSWCRCVCCVYLRIIVYVCL